MLCCCAKKNKKREYKPLEKANQKLARDKNFKARNIQGVIIRSIYYRGLYGIAAQADHDLELLIYDRNLINEKFSKGSKSHEIRGNDLRLLDEKRTLLKLFFGDEKVGPSTYSAPRLESASGVNNKKRTKRKRTNEVDYKLPAPGVKQLEQLIDTSKISDIHVSSFKGLDNDGKTISKLEMDLKGIKARNGIVDSIRVSDRSGAEGEGNVVVESEEVQRVKLDVSEDVQKELGGLEAL